VTAPGGTEADRAARERLAREARVTATALLDWVGTRVDGAATTRAAGTDGARPRQSPGPCGWCPVCALVAAVRGEQPELTAHLAEQASGLLVVLRLLLQSHVHEHPAHEHPAHEHPAHEHPAHEHPAATGPPRTDSAAATAAPPSPEPATGPAPDATTDAPADVLADPDVPWDAPHAVFDPDPAPVAPVPDGTSRPAPDRPTGKRGPRPSPRPRPVPAEPPVPAAPAAVGPRAPTTTPTTAPSPATAPAPARSPTGTRASAAPAPVPARSDRGVQRIPVRRRPRPC
jgi:hypothetical protein